MTNHQHSGAVTNYYVHEEIDDGQSSNGSECSDIYGSVYSTTMISSSFNTAAERIDGLYTSNTNNNVSEKIEEGRFSDGSGHSDLSSVFSDAPSHSSYDTPSDESPRSSQASRNYSFTNDEKTSELSDKSSRISGTSSGSSVYSEAVSSYVDATSDTWEAACKNLEANSNSIIGSDYSYTSDEVEQEPVKYTNDEYDL